MEKTKHPSEPIAVWCLTPNGLALGRKIKQTFPGVVLFVSKTLEEKIPGDESVCFFKKLSLEIKKRFHEHQNHICIFSTGIAVRLIGQLLDSKLTDPAVVVMDDNGNFAISLVSGHIGGANALARKVGEKLNAVPVITTATDTNNLPAIDMIAQEAGLYIGTPQNIKHINMAFLKGEPISIYDPLKILKDKLPAKYRSVHQTGPHQSGLYQTGPYRMDSCRPDKKNDRKEDVDIFCSWQQGHVSRETLVLRPKVLSVGIGCNRGTSVEKIGDFLCSVLEKTHLSIHSVCKLATTEVKNDEKGLLELSGQMNIPLDFYNKDQLNSVTTIKTPSKMAQKHLGVQSVCEAAAILSANNGKLLVAKHKNKDVTIAVAIIK